MTIQDDIVLGGLPIDPNRLYSAEELRSIIHGKVKLQRLRDHGLRSVGRGYLGSDIIAALESIIASKRSSPGKGGPASKAEKGNDQAVSRLDATRERRKMHPLSDSKDEMAGFLRDKFRKISRELED